MVGHPSGTRRHATKNAGKRAVWSSSASMCTSEPRGYGVPYRTAWSVWLRQGSPLREHPRQWLAFAMPVSRATRKALYLNLNAIALAIFKIGVACCVVCAAHAMPKKLRLESMRGTFQCIA